MVLQGFLLEEPLLGDVAVDHDRARKPVCQRLAPGRIALDDLQPPLADEGAQQPQPAPQFASAQQGFRNEAADPAAADQDDLTHSQFRPAGAVEDLVQHLLRRADVQLIPLADSRVAARQVESFAAQQPAHQELQRQLDARLRDRAVAEGRVAHDRQHAHLDAGVLERHHLAGRAVLHGLHDATRRFDLWIDDVVDVQHRSVEQVRPGVVLLIADARDLEGDGELARRQTAGHHVELVRVGQGDEELRVLDPGLAKQAQVVAGAGDDNAVQVVERVLGGVGVALDQGDVLVVRDELPGELEAGGAGPDHDDLPRHCADATTDRR